MVNNIQIIGGERSGEYIGWFGNDVRIQGVRHILHRITFTDIPPREFYIKEGTVLSCNAGAVARIEVLG